MVKRDKLGSVKLRYLFLFSILVVVAFLFFVSAVVTLLPNSYSNGDTSNVKDGSIAFNSANSELNNSFLNRIYASFNVTSNLTGDGNLSVRVYNASFTNVTNFTVVAHGNCTVFFNFTGLADGTYYIYANATNNSAGTVAGNNNWTIRSITIDTTVPLIDYKNVNNTYTALNNTLVNVSINDSNLYTYQTGGNNITFVLYNSTGYVNGTNMSYTSTAANTFYNATNWTQLVDGAYYFNVSVVDRAGNVNYTSTYKTTIDTTYPLLFFNGSTANNLINTTINNITLNVTIKEVNVNNITFYLYNTTGKVNETTYTLTSGITPNNTLNFSGVPDGIYTYNISVTDKANNRNYTNETRTITVDTSAPAVNLIYPLSGSNYSATSVNFNITASDSITAVNSCWMTLNNGLTNNTLVLTGTSYNYTNSSIGNGNYLAKFYCNDSVNNINNTLTSNFTVDTIAPNLTLSLGSFSTTTLNITITAADATSGLNGTCVSSLGIVAGTSSIYADGLSCGTGYNFNVTCYDFAGNSNNSLFVGTTDSCPSNGQGSSSYSSPSASELVTGFSKSMYAGEAVTFKSGNENHLFILTNVRSNSVNIQLSSKTILATLNVSEEKKFDLNNDSYYDISVKLNNITSGKADITLKSINESVTALMAATNATAPAVGIVPSSNVQNNNTSLGNKGLSGVSLAIIVIIVLIIILLIYFFIRAKKKKRYYLFGY